MALLKAVAALDLGVDDTGGDGDLAEIFSQDTLPELPDAYQAFQQNVSRRLARRRPTLGEELLVEALGRQMDDGAADAGAHRHVLAALAPWTAALHLPHIAAAGRADRLLKSLYFVTFFRGDPFPREMETMWRHIGHSPRNVVPALRFLETKGLEDTSSATAMSTYCLTAKRVCLYLARAAPQQSIDQLVYAISLRGLEVDYPRAPATPTEGTAATIPWTWARCAAATVGEHQGRELARPQQRPRRRRRRRRRLETHGARPRDHPPRRGCRRARRGLQGSPPRPTARDGGDARGVAGAHGAGALSPAPREPHARPRG